MRIVLNAAVRPTRLRPEAQAKPMMKGNMFRLRVISLALFTALATATVQGQTGNKKESGILEGPATARLGNYSEVKLLPGFIFFDGDMTRAMKRRAGEPVSGDELGFLRPTNGNWAVFFRFRDIGYIKDAEKEKLNPAKLLKQIVEGNDEANKERVKNGVSPLEVVGWDKEPVYDPVTHNLEWCIRARSEGHYLLNYKTEVLGRKGVMALVLVVDPEDLSATLPEFRKVIEGHQFVTGESYAEYRPGDKIAKYGLGALIVGGAAVAGMKLGLFAWIAVFFKKFAKLVVVAVIAIAVAIKKLFNKITGRGDSGS